MSLIKTLAAAGLDYWLGEREGERRVIERRPRFCTVADRRVWDDTGPGSLASRPTPAAPRWRSIVSLAIFSLACAAALPVICFLVLYSVFGRDPVRLALIVGGAMFALVGLLRLGLAGRFFVVALCLLFWAHFHV